jgi:hypothetical protein
MFIASLTCYEAKRNRVGSRTKPIQDGVFCGGQGEGLSSSQEAK